jgi:hypothetical protein
MRGSVCSVKSRAAKVASAPPSECPGGKRAVVQQVYVRCHSTCYINMRRAMCQLSPHCLMQTFANATVRSPKPSERNVVRGSTR